jgi:hypothetical protein
MERNSIQQSFGFALGGGGAKAFAQLGAIKALEEKGIKPSYFSGSSMGAVNSILLSAGYTVDEIVAFYKSVSRNKLFAFTPLGVSNKPIGALIQKMCEAKGFSRLEQLPLPVYCGSTVLKTRQKITLKLGPISEVVEATTSSYGIRKTLIKDIAVRRSVIKQTKGLYGRSHTLYLEDSCYTANVPFELLDEIRTDFPDLAGEDFYDFAFDVVPSYHRTILIGLNLFNKAVYVSDFNRRAFFDLRGHGTYFELDAGLTQTNFSKKAVDKGVAFGFRYINKFLLKQ